MESQCVYVLDDLDNIFSSNLYCIEENICGGVII